MPSHAAKGSNNCKRLDAGSTATTTLEPSAAGAWYPASSTAKPLNGNSSPVGGSNFTCSPLSLVKVSVNGLKVKSPAIASAVTISGDATNAKVLGLPSARFAKFLLKECTMVFFSFSLHQRAPTYQYKVRKRLQIPSHQFD